MIKAIIVARVSTEEQKEANNSLPAQIDRMKKYCLNHDYQVVDEFSFDESAYKSKREDFDAILDKILSQSEKVVVCFDKVDRLSRNIFDTRVSTLYEKALAGNVELHFVSDGQRIDSHLSAVEKFNFSISLGLAKYYSDAISDNVKRSQEAKLNRGIYPSKPPFGYKSSGSNDDRIVDLDPMTSQVVKLIYQIYESGNASMLEIKNQLKQTYSLEMNKSQIFHILQNEFYAGTMTWNGKKYPHKHPANVTEATFNKVTAIRLGHHKKHFKYAGLPYSYRSLIKCADCGCLITPEKKKGKYVYYHCTEHNGKHGAKWLTEDAITDQFVAIFDSMKIPDDKLEIVKNELLKVHDNKVEAYEDMVSYWRSEVDKWTKAIANNYRSLCTESITQAQADEFQKEFTAKRDDAQAKLNRLQQADNKCYVTLAYLVEIASRASELFKSSEREEKRQLLGMVVRNLTLDGEIVRYDLNFPFDTVAKYAPRSAWLPLLDSFHNGFMEGKLTYSLSEVDHFTKQLAHLLVETSIRMDVV